MSVRAIISAVMIISALCSGIAGMLGGTSLFGGQGRIGNTVAGHFVLGVLNNGFDHVERASPKIPTRGVILLVALIINAYAQRLRNAAPEIEA